jgi:hypothetical protein
VRVLLDTSTPLAGCAKELGCEVEQLLTPLTRFLPQDPGAPFAIDNGGYSRPDIAAFRALLKREWPRRKLCRFVAAPDVVGDARRTLELFWRFYDDLRGWPRAFVAQDGIGGIDIPWRHIEAVFIGGTTEFKTGPEAVAVIRAAQWMEKWVHVGRVNTPGRFEYFEKLGADSIDGSGLAKYSWMREAIYEAAQRPDLFSEPAA